MMMNRAVLKMTVLCFLCLNVIANPADSTRAIINHKPRFVFNFDGRYSEVKDSRAKIAGLKFGMEYRKMRYGLGIYVLETPVTTVSPLRKGEVPVNARIRFSYISPYAEYVFYQAKRWEFSVPVQLGFGDNYLQYTDTMTGETDQSRKISVALLEISVTGHYKFFSWVGIGAGFGYRKMLTAKPVIKDAFDAPIYVVKIKLFVGVLYRKVFPKKENKEQNN